MKEYTSEELAIKKLKKLISIIESEYASAKYAHETYLVEHEFESEEIAKQYALWSGGRLEAMKNLMIKTDRIRLDKFSDRMKGP